MENLSTEKTELTQNTNKSTTSNGRTDFPVLSDYMDFRLFLADFYNHKKDSTKNLLRPYSYGIFSAAADIKSPNYLKMIIEGKRNLSADMILKFARVWFEQSSQRRI